MCVKTLVLRVKAVVLGGTCASIAAFAQGQAPLTVNQPVAIEVVAGGIAACALTLDAGDFVYIPPGYRPSGPENAVLVLFDEGAFLEDPIPTPTILDNLIVAGRIPTTVAVLVANVGDRRTRDLSPNPEFAKFVATELMPWVRERYNVTRDPSHVVVGGASLGGLTSAYLGWRYSDVFGRVLSMSGSFWWAPDHAGDMNPLDATTETNWTAKQYIAAAKLPLEFHLDAGTFESDPSLSGGGILENSRHLRDVLLARGYEVHYQQFVGGHDYLGWRGTFADGLIALLEGN